MGHLYRVNEIFYSLQGEGVNQGLAFVFVRFSGCNLKCDFCDTTHGSHTLMSADEILAAAKLCGGNSRRVLFTGGEPGLQLDSELLSRFNQSWYTAVETNGTCLLPEGVDWIACSPKGAPTVLSYASELRYVLRAGDPLPKPTIEAQYYTLSPVFDGLQLNQDNLAHCVKLCQQYPRWRLSVQAHKLWGVR